MLVEDVVELLSIDWLVPGPTANVRIINNMLIVIALFSKLASLRDTIQIRVRANSKLSIS